jgi:integrase
VVKKVLRGIAELHPAPEKQARPLQLLQLQQVVQDIERQQRDGVTGRYGAERLRLARDKSLILMGFWRAFRSDELVRLCVEHIQIVPGDGMELLVPKSKTDHSGKGRSYKAPALRQLCPVAAYQDWIELAGLKAGPVYRSITRWGHLGETGLSANSVVPILRERLKQAGLADAETFTSHSLRRGFASWANANRWGVKTLMEYVGWKNAETAIRYIDAPDPFEEVRAVHNSGTTNWDAKGLLSSEMESPDE